MDFVNKREIRVCGLQRTGNHALIGWILDSVKGKKCLLNAATPGKDPFLRHSQRELYNISESEFEKDKREKSLKKDLLIYSYEDAPLDKIFAEKFEEKAPDYVGKSESVFNVIILRDPFNLFASRLQWIKRNKFLLDIGKRGSCKLNLTDEKQRLKLINIWKAYAKEFLGENEIVDENKLPINFNKWFAEKSYRKKIADTLQLNKNSNAQQVTGYGGGSSFDGQNLTLKTIMNNWRWLFKYQLYKNAFIEGQIFDYLRRLFNKPLKADKMKVLERWKTFKDDPFYRSLFKDNELIELSNRIFGRIPGTEKLLKN